MIRASLLLCFLSCQFWCRHTPTTLKIVVKRCWVRSSCYRLSSLVMHYMTKISHKCAYTWSWHCKTVRQLTQAALRCFWVIKMPQWTSTCLLIRLWVHSRSFDTAVSLIRVWELMVQTRHSWVTNHIVGLGHLTRRSHSCFLIVG